MEKFNIKRAYSHIKKAKNILLVTHDRPDGDAVSSVCALVDFLEYSNKKYTAFCKNLPAASFNFLPYVDKITDNSNYNFDDFDLIIVLDCGSMRRTNIDEKLRMRRKDQIVIEFDHHPKVDEYAEIEIRDSKAASTTQILYYFFKYNHIRINKRRANCILTGITTDTGNFLYPSTSKESMEIASEMLKRGARLPKIVENTWRNKSLKTMKIWGKAIDNLEINKNYNFAYAILTHYEILESGVSDEELEGIAGFLSNLYGVKGLVLLRETDNGIIKGSLRTSLEEMDISKLATYLGGGGHAKASGFRVKGKLVKTENGWRIE